jgi:hypothetical protein
LATFSFYLRHATQTVEQNRYMNGISPISQAQLFNNAAASKLQTA